MRYRVEKEMWGGIIRGLLKNHIGTYYYRSFPKYVHTHIK